MTWRPGCPDEVLRYGKDAGNSGRTGKRDSELAGVSTREMMGCLCYLHREKMLAFLVTGGIVISKLSQQEQDDLSKLSKKISFKMGSKSIRKSVWELKTRDDLRNILPFVKASYQATGKIK